MPNTSAPKRKKENKPSVQDAFNDWLEQLLSLLRPRTPARVPVRRPTFPRRMR